MPATELQYGKAKIFGLDGAVITGVVTFTMSDINWQKNADYTELKNQNGDVETTITANRHQMIDVTFAPNGVTRANALTSLATLTALEVGAQVVLATCEVAAFNGTYNIQPGFGAKLVNESNCIATFTAKKGPIALALAS